MSEDYIILVSHCKSTFENTSIKYEFIFTLPHLNLDCSIGFSIFIITSSTNLYTKYCTTNDFNCLNNRPQWS